MKPFKKILATIGIIFCIVFVNGIYYVFFGQDKSVAKLDRGEELNLYECCSIYSMHCAIWMFGWPISPEASRQAFLMLFESKDRTEFNRSMFDSKIINRYSNKKKSKLFFNINAMHIYDIRYALALNGGTYYNTPSNVEIEVDCSYGKRTDIFNLGIITIKLNYKLFSYIQDKNWIHSFRMRYYDPLFCPA